jgi:NHLM bacteriocin system ABC transporter ATP-binding protein
MQPTSGFLLQVLRSEVVDRPEEPVTFSGEVTSLGRNPDCDLVLSSRSVSRYHAEIRHTEEGYLLVDLGSANGVWVDERRVELHHLEDGQEFRLGNVLLRFSYVASPAAEPAPTPPPRAEEPPAAAEPEEVAPAEPSETTRAAEQRERAQAPPRSGAALADRFTEEGEALAVGGNRPFLLQGEDAVWFVACGKIEIFTTGLENGRPSGARSHFVTIDTGELLLGMDFERYQMGSGFLAVGHMGTELRRLPMARFRELAQEEDFAAEIAEKLDRWISSLSRSLTEAMIPGTNVDTYLEPGQEIALENQRGARPGRGVVWVEARDGNLLFVGLEELLFGEDASASADAAHSMILSLAELVTSARKERPLFPLSPESWIEATSARKDKTRVCVHATTDIMDRPLLWQSLSLFHEVLCQCEFINKRLALVDEFQRLRTKADYARATKEAAYADIAGVLERPTARPLEAAAADESRDPVYLASKLVGESLGVQIVSHPEMDDKMSLPGRVDAVAKASRCRIRKIALRDDWWKRDQGPFVGQMEESGEPVALLPAGATSYVCVDPKSGERAPVTEEAAARMAVFGYSFYPPFPPGTLRVVDLVKFGARGLRRDFAVLVGMGLTLGLLGSLTPYFTGQLFDTAIPEADRGLLVQFTAGLFFAALVAAAFKITQSIAVLRTQGRMDYKIQAALWDRLLNLPSTFFRAYSSGDVAARAAGISQIRSLLAGAGIGAILGAVSSIFYVALMFFYSATLAALAMGLTILFVGFTTAANYLQLRYQRDQLHQQGLIAGLVLQFIFGVGKIRVCGAENHAFRAWAREFASQRKLEFRIGEIQNTVAVFSSGFAVVSSMAIFAALAISQRDALAAGAMSAMSTGGFIAFTAAYGSFLVAMQALADASLSLLRIVPIYERLKPILTAKPEIDESKSYPGKLKGEIELSHIQFRYAEDAPWILDDVSLEIRPGEFIAFVGASGSGKSTLMRLMLGFETPQRGSVYYDGQDLANLDIREVRQQLGVVLQDSRLLPADIFRNIAGAAEISMDAAWNAARLAGLAEDIEELPMGMHTYVSEGGGGFSGGQRQRLLIARALVRNPRIVFLDEATSALDNRSQAVVTESMERLQATRIVVAHRLSTVKNADRICYLKGGRIVEMGTYDELMKLDGLFAELARRQMA